MGGGDEGEGGVEGLEEGEVKTDEHPAGEASAGVSLAPAEAGFQSGGAKGKETIGNEEEEAAASGLATEVPAITAKSSYANVTGMRSKSLEKLSKQGYKTNETGDLVMPPEMMHKGLKRWENTVVGTILGRQIPTPVVIAQIRRLWARWNSVDIRATTSGLLLIKLRSEQHVDEVLQRSDWSVLGCYLAVRKWVPGLCVERMQQTSLPL